MRHLVSHNLKKKKKKKLAEALLLLPTSWILIGLLQPDKMCTCQILIIGLSVKLQSVHIKMEHEGNRGEGKLLEPMEKP